MDSKRNTKKELVLVAGKLFARFGYESVSTRMIAKEAEKKLSAIHYHFGSKENLYGEAIKYAVEVNAHATFNSVLRDNPQLLKTPEGLAKLIHSIVFNSFEDHFNSYTPEWIGQLILREIMEPSDAFAFVVEKKIQPEVDSAKLIYRSVRPDAVDSEVYAWLDLYHSQIFFYMMSKDPITNIRGKDALSKEYYKNVVRVLARAMILELALPLPEELK